MHPPLKEESSRGGSPPENAKRRFWCCFMFVGWKHPFLCGVYSRASKTGPQGSPWQTLLNMTYIHRPAVALHDTYKLMYLVWSTTKYMFYDRVIRHALPSSIVHYTWYIWSTASALVNLVYRMYVWYTRFRIRSCDVIYCLSVVTRSSSSNWAWTEDVFFSFCFCLSSCGIGGGGGGNRALSWWRRLLPELPWRPPRRRLTRSRSVSQQNVPHHSFFISCNSTTVYCLCVAFIVRYPCVRVPATSTPVMPIHHP